MINRRFVSLLLFVQCLVPTPTAPGQQSTSQRQRPRPEAEGPVELAANLVVLDVTVVDKENKPVGSLQKEDFTVLEDGTTQPVSFFSREETPVSVGLVIDTSGSMRRKLNKVTAAGLKLVRQSHVQDEVFVVEFNQEAELVQDFTNDLRDIEYAMEDLVARGQTALLDAVFLAVEHAQKYGKHRRKAVVVITDGEERDSYYTRDQSLQALRASEVQVYVVGFPEGLDAGQYNVFRGTGKRKLGRLEKRARKLLDELAATSGARAFYPQALEELDSITETIAAELRTQYILGYYPTRSERDGSWRKVAVHVRPDKTRGEINARTRAGYYAIKPGQAPKDAPKPSPRK